MDIKGMKLAERQLMKYAMLYVADLLEEIFPDEIMTVERFIELTNITFDYTETQEGSRIDGFLSVYMEGESEATFHMNIAR